MIRSMTGFGRYSETVNGMDITVEIRSVNHRYYEFSARIPRAYVFLEEKLKNHLQQSVARGKVEVSVFIDTLDTPGTEVAVNYSLAEGYVNALRDLARRFEIREDVSASLVSRFPDVLTVRKTELEEAFVWEAVKTVANGALERFVSMREREGEKLREDVLSRAATILSCVSFVEEKSPQTVKAHMETVTARMKELLEGAAVEEQRLLTEAAIFADKIAVAEETVRLRSHISQLEAMLSGDEAIGRKLDFLVQEINRECNTIGSKAQDVEIARTVVDMKAEVEKIREQIQNIE